MSGCTATHGLATASFVCDRRARYRKRRHTQAPELPSEPVRTQTSLHDDRERAQAYDASARWRHITELNARLSETLDDEGRALWLALEEALHVHWLDVAVNHYNRGYAAGRAQSWVDETLADANTVHDKLRAIALALAEVIEAFDVPRRSS
jgi:hypothetical protein